MRLFRKKIDDQPVDPNERSPQLGVKYKDLMVMKSLVDNGADLAASRHVVFYSYAPSQEAAAAMKRESEGSGWNVKIGEPGPEAPGHWAVTCDKHAVTSMDFVRDTDNFFQEMADRHGAKYDGWEASV